MCARAPSCCLVNQNADGLARSAHRKRAIIYPEEEATNRDGPQILENIRLWKTMEKTVAPMSRLIERRLFSCRRHEIVS